LQTYSLLRREGANGTRWIVTSKGHLIGSFPTQWQALGTAIGAAADAARDSGSRVEVIVHDDEGCRPHVIWANGNEIRTWNTDACSPGSSNNGRNDA
jgi:hypothetical protein